MLRQRKKNAFAKKFLDINKSDIGIDKDSPSAQQEEEEIKETKDMSFIEKPKEDDKDVNQWGE